MTANNPLRKAYRQDTGKNIEPAIVGRSSDGRVWVENDSALVYVRRPASNGQFTREAQVRGPRSSMSLVANQHVWLETDRNGELYVSDLDFSATVASGVNPMIVGNAGAKEINKYIGANRIASGCVRAVEGTMLVGVAQFVYIYNDTVYRVADQQIDLTSSVPSSGNHLLVLVYVDASGDVQVATSTAQLIDEPFDLDGLTDFQEAHDAASSLLIPLWYWYLRSDTTTLTNAQYPAGNDVLDARPFVGGSGGGGVPAIDGVTKTVGSGKDFSTIQALYNFFAPGKLISDCTGAVDAGTYPENLVFANLLAASDAQLTIEGDTRELAGLSYPNGPDASYGTWAATTGYTAATSKVVPTTANGLYYRATTTGTSGGGEPTWPTTIGGTVVDGTVTWLAEGIPCNRTGATNGGTTSGACQLVRSGGSNEVLTVTVATTNPDFDADGWGAGDKVMAYDGSTTFTELTIDSVLNNTITVTTSWPAGVENFGGGFTLLPNRIIQPASGTIVTNTTTGVLLKGFYLKGDAANITLQSSGGSIQTENCAFYSTGTNNLLVTNDAFLNTNLAPASFLDGQINVNQSKVNIKQIVLFYCAIRMNIASKGEYGSDVLVNASARASTNSTFDMSSAYLLNSSSGYEAISGYIAATSSYAYNCSSRGYWALDNGTLSATSSSARDCGTGYLATNASEINATATSSNAFNNTTNYNPAVSGTAATDASLIIWT